MCKKCCAALRKQTIQLYEDTKLTLQTPIGKELHKLQLDVVLLYIDFATEHYPLHKQLNVDDFTLAWAATSASSFTATLRTIGFLTQPEGVMREVMEEAGEHLMDTFARIYKEIHPTALKHPVKEEPKEDDTIH